MKRHLFTQLARIRGGRQKAAELAQQLAAANPHRCLIIDVRPPRVARLSGPVTYIAVLGDLHRTPSAGGNASFCAGCGLFLESAEWTISEVPLAPHVARAPEADRYRRWRVDGGWCPECGPEDQVRFGDYQDAWRACQEAAALVYPAAGGCC